MPVNFVNIPDALKQSASFCVWKLEKRGGRPTKVPYDPRTRQMAKTNEPSTFTDFNTAMKAYAIGGWDGIGYRVSEGIGAIDIDHCIREDGSLNDVAASILGIFSTAYFEKSPSGTGLRGFFKLSPDFAYDKTVYYINNRKHGLEVYLPGTTNRFVTVTGDMFRPGTVERDDDALRNLLDTFMKRSTRVSNKTIEPASYLDDEGVIAHASASASGDKFKALYAGNWEKGYDSQSDADMAFVSMLCFWCGNVEEQIDRIFRTSGLMRDKWDRKTGDATYGQITIRNAVATNSAVYTPIADSTAEDDFDDIEGDAENEQLMFEPDLTHVSLTLEQMQPHTNPAISVTRSVLAMHLRITISQSLVSTVSAVSGMSLTGRCGSRTKMLSLWRSLQSVWQTGCIPSPFRSRMRIPETGISSAYRSSNSAKTAVL